VSAGGRRENGSLGELALPKGGSQLRGEADDAAHASPPVDITAQAHDFLLLAVQALEEYEPYCKANREGKATGRPPAFGVEDDVANSKLWRFFLLEMDEILEYKWIESQRPARTSASSAPSSTGSASPLSPDLRPQTSERLPSRPPLL
jgi:hypothetical protein